MANFIYEPSYVSFESALSFYGILSHLKQSCLKNFDRKTYKYYRLKKELFWGYLKENKYLIAEKEKALADQLYLASKGLKKVHLEEYNLSLIDKTKLKSYL